MATRLTILGPASLCMFTSAVALLPSRAWAASDAAGPDSTVVAAACLALGIAILGGALGQGRAAAAAYDGICRNPSASEKVFTPLILGLALIESLVILGFVALNMVLFS